MTKLPRDVPAKKVIAALEKIGFRIDRVSGSHYVMVREGMRTVVPYHKSIRIGTLKAILRQIEMSAEEFIKLL
jgi:predicted RNA binding protein YcfA (HicA-like mRNA interferase family)